MSKIWEFILRLFGIRRKQKRIEEKKEQVIFLPDFQYQEVKEETKNRDMNNNITVDHKESDGIIYNHADNASIDTKHTDNKNEERMNDLIKEFDDIKKRYHIDDNQFNKQVEQTVKEPDENSVQESSKLDTVMEKIVKLQKDAALAVEKKIDELPSVGSLTLKDKDVVNDVKSSFDMLTPDVKTLIPERKVKKLNESINKIAELQRDFDAATAVEAAIDALKPLSSIALSDKAAVNEAKALYDALTEPQRLLIAQPKITKLEAAVSRINQLMEDVEAAMAVEAAMDQIPSAEEVTLDDKADIYNVKAALDKLSKEKRALIPQAKIINFNAAVKKVEQLQRNADIVSKVEESINKLGSPGSLTLAHKDEVNRIKSSFDSLTKAQREMVSPDLINKLGEAVNHMLKLQEATDAAEAFMNKVKSLPDIDRIDLSLKAIIEEYMAIYDNMSDSVKALVDLKDLDKLKKAEKKILAIQSDIETASVIEGYINALPSLSDITLDKIQEVNRVKQVYDALTESQKAFVNQDNVKKLNALIDKLEKMKSAAEEVKEIESLIRALPKQDSITLDYKDEINKLMDKIENLPKEQKEMIDPNDLSLLKAAYKRVIHLQFEADAMLMRERQKEKLAEEAAVTTETNAISVDETKPDSMVGTALADSAKASKKTLSVLIVDDASFMRTILKKMIEETEGFTVVGEAINGHQAIEQVKRLKPDIVTMDITMPDMDGISVVKEVLQILPKTKIIMCTAVNQKSMIIQAIKNGAKDFITKPFDKVQVQEALKSVANL